MYKILMLDKDTLDFKVMEIEKRIVTCDDINKGVEGYIEHISFVTSLEERGINVWCNEEGKLKDLKPSTLVLDHPFTQQIVEVLAGNLVFTKRLPEGYDGVLTDEEIEFIKEQFGKIAKMKSKKPSGEEVVENVRVCFMV